MALTEVELTKKQLSDLESLARRENVSVAELVQRSVDQYLQSRFSSPIASDKPRVLGVIGKYRSGVSDVSENHDQYLAE